MHEEEQIKTKITDFEKVTKRLAWSQLGFEFAFEFV